MLNPNICEVAALAQTQASAVLEFWLNASAAGTEHVLISGQKAMSGRLLLLTGNGSAAPTLARLKNITKDATDKVTADAATLAATLVAYFAAIPAAADAANSIAFAIGGIRASEILRAEIEITTASTTAAQVNRSLSREGGQKLLALADAPVYGTDNLCVCQNVVFGSIALTDVTDAPAAGEKIALRIWVK